MHTMSGLQQVLLSANINALSYDEDDDGKEDEDSADNSILHIFVDTALVSAPFWISRAAIHTLFS